MKLETPQDSKLFKKGEPITLTVFPKIESMMTGVVSIAHNHPRYLITYTDGTAEESIVNEPAEFTENLFTYVRTIQDTARA